MIEIIKELPNDLNNYVHAIVPPSIPCIIKLTSDEVTIDTLNGRVTNPYILDTLYQQLRDTGRFYLTLHGFIAIMDNGRPTPVNYTEKNLFNTSTDDFEIFIYDIDYPIPRYLERYKNILIKWFGGRLSNVTVLHQHNTYNNPEIVLRNTRLDYSVLLININDSSDNSALLLKKG